MTQPVAVVTGGTRGLGLAYRAFAATTAVTPGRRRTDRGALR